MTVVIPTFSDNMDGFVTHVCRTETVRGNPASLERPPRLLNSGKRLVAWRSRVASATAVVPCCTDVVTSLTCRLRSKSCSTWCIFCTRLYQVEQRSRLLTDSLPEPSSSIIQEGIEVNSPISTFAFLSWPFSSGWEHRNTGCPFLCNYPIILFVMEFNYSFGVLSLVPYQFLSSPGPRQLQRPCTNSRAQDATSTTLCKHFGSFWFVRHSMSINTLKKYDSSLEFWWRSTFLCHHLLDFLEKNCWRSASRTAPNDLYKVKEFSALFALDTEFDVRFPCLDWTGIFWTLSSKTKNWMLDVSTHRAMSIS